MRREEADNILSYVAQNIISPLAFDETPAKEVWLRLCGDDFKNLCNFVHNMTDKTYPCDEPNSHCPYNAQHYEDCRVHCGLGVDED